MHGQLNGFNTAVLLGGLSALLLLAGQLIPTSALMITNPFRGGGMAKLFSTHPPMAERIARLEAMVARP